MAYTYTNTIYPPPVEEKLITLCDCIPTWSISISYGEVIKQVMHPQCIRYVFGPVLFKRWMIGEEVELSEDMMIDLLNQAAAESLVYDLEVAGEVDSVEDVKGEHIIFFPPKQIQ